MDARVKPAHDVCRGEAILLSTRVIAGLDPAIHHLRMS
jgi:hypothetical protein